MKQSFTLEVLENPFRNPPPHPRDLGLLRACGSCGGLGMVGKM